MSDQESANKQRTNYVLVPATIIEDESESTSRRNRERGRRIPHGAKIVEGGYIINGFFYTDFDSEMGKSMVKTSIMPKLEFIFSDKYFAADKFLRPYMDVEGYFPIYLLLFIPAIQQFGVDVDALAEILADCPLAEVDMSRMTVRPKTNWEQWIMPNPMGGNGVPRYAVIGSEIPSK